MASGQNAGYCARIALPLILAAGCSMPKASLTDAPAIVAAPRTLQDQGNAEPPSVIQPPLQLVVHRLPTVEPTSAPTGDMLFSGQSELSLQQLNEAVLARNASLQAMMLAWQSANQRYPQAIALDDPMVMGVIAPGSVNAATVETGYVLGASQKLPWFGKRSARGEAAQADASAKFHDVRDAQLQLTQTTRAAFFEYYLVARELEINRENLELTREFGDTARSKYENKQVTQQDVSQADLEYASTERRLLELERMMRVATARINALLQRNPDETLPPPPKTLRESVAMPPIDSLRQLAVSQRPDLAALRARIAAEQAAVVLAEKQFYPDAEVYGRYDTFWQPAATQGPLRGQVGVNMNLPIYRQKLNAALCEAQFRLGQRQAEYRQKMVDVQFEVESAYAQIQEAQQAIALYHAKLLPAAEQNVQTARADYNVGSTTFLNLLVAQRQLLGQREQYQQIVAASASRRAELERAVGGSLPMGDAREELPRPSR